MKGVDWIGAGIGFRKRYARELLSLRPTEHPPILEVLPDHFFGNPEGLAALAEQYSLIFHDIGCSVGTDKPIDLAHLQRLKSLVKIGRPLLFSDHLAMTQSPSGLDIGHLAPLRMNQKTLTRVANNVHRLQDELNIPILLENITHPFIFPDNAMSEGAFFHELVKMTGCGLLLDVSNILINARNFGQNPRQLLNSFPLHAVQQVHLAGGRESNDWWVDSHGTSVETQSFDLLTALPSNTPLKSIIVEQDDNLPPLSILLKEATQAQSLWAAHTNQA